MRFPINSRTLFFQSIVILFFCLIYTFLRAFSFLYSLEKYPIDKNRQKICNMKKKQLPLHTSKNEII